MSASRRRAIRRPLQCTLGPDGVLAVLRGDAHPFALVGAWAGGRAVLGSEPVAQAAPPESLERVFGPQGSPVPPSPAVFAGGWVGYLGYAAGQEPATAARALARALPAWWFGYYDHVLVRETMNDVLGEALDLEGLTRVLGDLASGRIRCIAVDTPTPSVFSHEILNANPYAYLDDAPLEERRARAVEMRRVLPPDMASEIGRLDPSAENTKTDRLHRFCCWRRRQGIRVRLQGAC